MSQYDNYDDEYYDDGYYDDDYDDGDDYGDATASRVVTKTAAKQVKQATKQQANAKTTQVKQAAAKTATTKKLSSSKSTTNTPLSSIKATSTSADTPSSAATLSVSQSLQNLSVNGNAGTGSVKRSPSKHIALADATATDIAKAEKWYRDRAALIEITYDSTAVNDKLNIVVIGHVDAGKSTLMGHVLHLQGRINDRLIQKYERESRELGKQSFAYAWVLDSNDTERTRGVTTDIAVNWFDTEKKHVTLLDAPGHRDFIPNMISGVAQAECALLVVPAVSGEFETAFSADGQTQEHAVLARALGVQQIVVCVNKLDSCDYSQARYDEICSQVIQFLTTTAGYKPADVLCIPISGLTGENIKTRSDERLSWYTGNTLINLIDTQLNQTVKSAAKPFRMAISDLFKSQTLGYTISGKIESGSVAGGDTLLVMPINETVAVKVVECRGQRSSVAVAGDTVELGINTNSIDTTILSIGQWLCAVDAPVPLVTQFTAQILVMNTKQPILAGTACTLYTGITYANVMVSKLIATIDKSTGETLKNAPRALPKLSSASVEITSTSPICMELYKSYRELGRFTLRRQTDTIAVGVVTLINR